MNELIETYKVDDKEVSVFRDDLNSPFPGPNNSKIHGVRQKIKELAQTGHKAVASQDTSISRIGWAVSQVVSEFDIVHYNFYAKREKMNFYQRMSKHWGGMMIPVRGSYSSAMRAQAQKFLDREKIDAYFLPTALSMKEAVYAHAQTVLELDLEENTNVVCCASSGTIAAGILYGLALKGIKANLNIILASSYKNREDKIIRLFRDTAVKYKYPNSHASGSRWFNRVNISIIDLHYDYKQKISKAPPFPCDLYLDRKAWLFIEDNIELLESPILFWNVGGEWHPELGMVNGLRGDGITTQKDINKLLGDK